MRSGTQVARSKGVFTPNIEPDGVIPFEVFEKCGLPPVVECNGCLMSMALLSPSGQLRSGTTGERKRVMKVAITTALLLLVAVVSGCHRYSPPMKWEFSTRIDRGCYSECRMKHHLCMASRTERSPTNCDKAESWCVQTCASLVEVKVPDYEKIRLMEKCGAPTPGVSEEIFWNWCRKGLL